MSDKCDEVIRANVFGSSQSDILNSGALSVSTHNGRFTRKRPNSMNSPVGILWLSVFSGEIVSVAVETSLQIYDQKIELI